MTVQSWAWISEWHADNEHMSNQHFLALVVQIEVNAKTMGTWNCNLEGLDLPASQSCFENQLIFNLMFTSSHGGGMVVGWQTWVHGTFPGSLLKFMHCFGFWHHSQMTEAQTPWQHSGASQHQWWLHGGGTGIWAAMGLNSSCCG